MRTLLKIVIGLAAVFAAAVIAGFWYTSGMVNTANAFFEALKNEDFEAAQVYLSEEFKAGTGEAELKQFLFIDPVAGLGEDGTLVLSGHFPTKPDQVYFTQTYVYEGIGWKLIGFIFDVK